MNKSDETKLNRFLGGFTTSDEMQEPPGPDGDPQLSALTQFFQTLVGTLGPDDVILDLGSGRGILAHTLLRMWSDGETVPWYYAVDLDDTLDVLSLPRRIHNHSQKVSFADFTGGNLPCLPEKVKVAVVRNITHELDIQTTAEVLVALRKIVRLGGQVYLQDIVSLPKGERENAGWASDLLRRVLERLGFDCGLPASYHSRSGTEWFTMILKEKAGQIVPSVIHATRIVAEGREQQRQRRAARLAELGDSTEETLTEYIMLATEVGALTTQLQRTHYASVTEMTATREVAELPLIALPASPLDYAEEMSAPIRSRSGLGGILSSKNLIDLPALLRRTVSRLWFAGYSQRLLFTIPEVRAVLLEAAKQGVDIRILLVDPNSSAARARSVSEAYAKPEDFFADVLATNRGFEEFEEELKESVDPAVIRCELRFCTSMLSSSFFFVDDLCICSLYSANLTGGAGGAFVFKSSAVQPNGYFQVLLREFQSAWGNT